jgi:hypothetical protein
MSGSTKRQCDRALTEPPLPGLRGSNLSVVLLASAADLGKGRPVVEIPRLPALVVAVEVIYDQQLRRHRAEHGA